MFTDVFFTPASYKLLDETDREGSTEPGRTLPKRRRAAAVRRLATDGDQYRIAVHFLNRSCSSLHFSKRGARTTGKHARKENPLVGACSDETAFLVRRKALEKN